MITQLRITSTEVSQTGIEDRLKPETHRPIANFGCDPSYMRAGDRISAVAVTAAGAFQLVRVLKY